MNPLISVFVPTKNRYVFLKEFINLVEGFNDPRIELVVQDNSDDNAEIVAFLDGRELVSTKFFYSNERMSMSENSNLAFSHCTGDYVCMMGDDDAICRNIADCAQWMKDNDIDAVRASEVQLIYEGKGSDILYYEPITPTCKWLNPEKEVKKVLRRGLVDFGNIAKVYHGIVKRTVLLAFLKNNNKETIFPGCTPDMSGSMVASMTVKRFVKLGIPVLLPGLSKVNSGGLSGQILTLDEVPWITQKTRDSWEKEVPRIWAREFIWPESGSKGLRYCGRDDLLDKSMNYYMSRCRYMIMHKQYRKDVISSAPSKFLLFIAYIWTLLTVGGRFFINRKVRAKLNHRMNGIYEYTHDCHSVAEAENYLYDKSRNYVFDKIIP